MLANTKSIEWLTTLDLEQFVRNFGNTTTKAAFLGVFPIDHLPRTIVPEQLPILFIVNTNTSNLPGQHWKAIYISKEGIGEIFDSLALPISLRLEQWMNKFSKKWTHSKITLQNPFAPTCGGYVLYYVLNRLQHNSMGSCIARFTANDVFSNDFIINQLIKAYSS